MFRSGLFRRSRGLRNASLEAPSVDQARPDEVFEQGAFESLLREVEQEALQIYLRHGLPTQPGQYAKSPKSQAWRFIDAMLSAEERWALLLANPGWRFSGLEDLGAHHGGPPEVAAAARLLARCRDLRAKVRSGGALLSVDDLEAAIRLGVEWRSLTDWLRSEPPSRSQLKLVAPKKVRARKKKTAASPPAG